MIQSETRLWALVVVDLIQEAEATVAVEVTAGAEAGGLTNYNDTT